MESSRFLNLLFSNVPQNFSMNLWTLKSKSSTWFNSNEIFDVEVAGLENVYIGVSFIDKNVANSKGEFARITMKDARGLVGLWADIDYGDEGHKKGHKNPPTETDALYLLECLPLKPTIVVHSGNGLQPWWLFNKPWVFDNEEARVEAQNLELGWLQTIRAFADKHQWSVDGTFDIARVLRIPGTINCKPGADNKEVRILEESGIRYSPEEFSRNIQPAATATKLKMIPMEQLSEIVVDPERKIDSVKFATMLTIDKKFQESFFRNRKDAALKDKSNSGYDLSLASMAVKAGWSNQEITDLLVTSRKMADADIMADKPSYYIRTIEKARITKNANNEDSRLDPLDEIFDSINSDDEDEKPKNGTKEPFDKKSALEIISGIIGVKITRVVRYVSSPPNAYQINTEDHGNIDMGGIANITNQRQFRDRIADLCRVLIPTFKADKFDKLAQLILRCSEDESIGESDADSGRSWLADYMRARQPTEDMSDSADRQWPLNIEGRGVYIYADNLRQWLEQRGTAKVTSKSLGTILRSLGCEREQISLKIGNVWSSRSLWYVPSDYLEI